MELYTIYLIHNGEVKHSFTATDFNYIRARADHWICQDLKNTYYIIHESESANNARTYKI